MRLEARGVTVSVKTRPIIQGCDLTLAPGELVGLIGPNGAGKSTLLRAIMGLGPRQAGEVLLNGRPAASIPDRERARSIAFLPQDRRVEWRLRARDVVMLGRYPHQSGFGAPTAADHAAVERAIAQVDAGGFVERPVTVLSGGERTRILLARALAVEAPLLLVDEPIAALDPYHQLHVMEILQAQARQGRGVLAVIHDLALASRFMDRLVLMGEGRVVSEGPPADVLSDARLQAVYRIAVYRGERDGVAVLAPWARSEPGETSIRSGS